MSRVFLSCFTVFSNVCRVEYGNMVPGFAFFSSRVQLQTMVNKINLCLKGDYSNSCNYETKRSKENHFSTCGSKVKASCRTAASIFFYF